MDIDAATAAVGAWKNRPACAIIKHTTPCGIAVGRTALDALHKARATDPVSSFGAWSPAIPWWTANGGIAARPLRRGDRRTLGSEDALAVFAEKKNLRVVELPIGSPAGSLDWKSVRGGFLVQDRFTFDPSEEGWRR